MTALVWDQAGERTYQTGVDKGVLYLRDGTAVAWNGLTSIEESPNATVTPYFIDGVKFYDKITPGDFSGKLKAVTYPDEFDQVLGEMDVVAGLSFHDQPGQVFSLAYRTKIGNDVDGIDHGYKLHLLYNLTASPDVIAFQSLQNKATPIEFAWTLNARPPLASGYRPTSHISLDSRDASSTVMTEVENALYGTSTTEPRLLSIQDITTLFMVG